MGRILIYHVLECFGARPPVDFSGRGYGSDFEISRYPRDKGYYSCNMVTGGRDIDIFQKGARRDFARRRMQRV